MKSMKISKYFQIIKPIYKFMKIIPDKSIKNNKTANIANAIVHMYKTINKRIYRENKKIFFETNFKVSYLIDISKNNTSFYFIVPVIYIDIVVEKIREVWEKATIEIKDNIELITKGETYSLNYKYQDALSLDVNRKTNEPLNSILNVLEIMKDNDRVMIVYNFIPHNFYSWNSDYKNTMKNLKANKTVIRDKNSSEYILKSLFSILSNILNSLVEVICEILGEEYKKETNFIDELATTLEKHKELSIETKKKKECLLLETQIAVISESNDIYRGNNNAITVCQAFNSLNEDNELIYKKTNSINIKETRFKIEGNIFSTSECANFIQLPGRNLMRRLGIKHTEVNEINIPKELQNGYLELGTAKFREEKRKVYLEDSYDKTSLPLVLVGAQGAGKSTYIANYYKFANRRKEGGVVIDYIKNNELSDEIIGYLPKEDVIILDFTKEDSIQSFAFNELELCKEKNIFKRLELANLQAQQIIELVNAINPIQPLQARMQRYLGSAASIVFASGENRLIEVIKCLEDFKVRKYYINKVKKYKEFLADEIADLEVLDEYSKPTKENKAVEVIGTKDSKIEGIIDRISLLRSDFKLKYMYNKDSRNNINFANQLEKGKVIIIKMPQSSFKKQAKNVITTFILSKVWIATELRGSLNKKPKKSHICVDEIFQAPTAMKMLYEDDILGQTRKFGCKFIFSCQGLSQIEILKDTLIEVGGSFMLLNGSSEKDFNCIKNKVNELDYSDIQYMDEYSSMNLIYYSKGYASFITKLPKPETSKKRQK